MNISNEAMYWESLNGKVKCTLCPHYCIIENGKTGICGVRKNENGTLKSLIYKLTTSMHVDPIEKKPLFHFHPTEKALSLSPVGCNFKCKQCQNWSISQDTSISSLKKVEPEEVIINAKSSNCKVIAWTYNEPTIWFEYTLVTSVLAKQNGLYTVYVTNGYINEEPLKEISQYLDAMNIDVKAFSDDFYKKICGGRLQPVLDTVIRAKKLGIHVELTYLIIPTLNDSENEIRDFISWVMDNVGEDVPIHFSKFHPDYKLRHLPETPISKMKEAYEIAKDAGMNYVYLGNVSAPKYENTYCPNCNTILIEREYYTITIQHLKNGKCDVCGNDINIVF